MSDSDTITEAIIMLNEDINILKISGCQLWKWSSNVEGTCIETNYTLHMNDGACIKTLGPIVSPMISSLKR